MNDHAVTYVINEDEAGARLDLFVVQLVARLVDQRHDVSRSQVRRWIEEERILLNGGPPPKAGVRLRPGDQLDVTLPEADDDPVEVRPQPLALSVVYEDDALLAINKPKGMVVHPAPGHSEGTLVNALLYHYPQLEGVGGAGRPGIVHRLDKETSGLMLVAKTPQAYHALVAALKARRIVRRYIAIAHGVFTSSTGTIATRIGRHPVHRKKMAVVSEGGKEAITHYRVVERMGNYSLVALTLETGRTHQIRVHLAHIAHPVVGDTTYGPSRSQLTDDGQVLHACSLQLRHPTTGACLTLWVPPPKNFRRLLRALRIKAGAD